MHTTTAIGVSRHSNDEQEPDIRPVINYRIGRRDDRRRS